MPNPEDLLSSLDPEQRQVAETLRGPVAVLAGAGTGKTRAVTHRIAYGVAAGVYKPTEVLAVTFTTKAAGELRERLRGLGADGVQARTFHSAALRQARYFWPYVYGGEFPELVKSKVPILRKALGRLGTSAPPDLVRDIAAEIEWAKVSNVRPADYGRVAEQEHRQLSELTAVEIGEIYATYEAIKREFVHMDMEDILLANAAILSENERIAAQVRSQYRWFVVDEFQDVNPLQAALLDLWLGGREELCVVGDPRQTIYSFAGATHSYLTEFGRKYPQAERIELVRNYRSTPQIVAAANAVYADSRAAGVQLISQSEAGQPVMYQGYADEAAEAADIASQLKSLHQRNGIAYRQMAVLYRINAQSETYQEALGAQNIPYSIRGDVRFFDRPEVRQAVTLLRGAARAAPPPDPPAPDNYHDAATVSHGIADEVRSLLGSIGYTDEPPQGTGTVRDRWESLHTLMTMATDLGADGTLTDLVADLDRRAGAAHAPTMEGVTLATVHSAKGLEWDAVFCIGMHEGTMPLFHAKTAGELEEERRLFYVGLTRARYQLSISWSAARSQSRHSNRPDRQPSRYLDALLPAKHPARKVGAQTRKKPRQRVPDVLPDDAVDLFEALRAWRAERAGKEKVPAYVVFRDDTLRAIAVHRPQTVAELSSINGIGKVKLEGYGSEVLDIITQQTPAANQP